MQEPAITQRYWTPKQNPKAGKVIYIDFQRKQRQITLSNRIDRFLDGTADFIESKQGAIAFYGLLLIAGTIFALHMLAPALRVVF